jgi:hypothetical protein
MLLVLLALLACDPNVTADTDASLLDTDAGPDCELRTYWHDEDGDLHGDPDSALDACERPAGYVDVDDDCNDQNPGVHPDAAEACDQGNVDEDCNGLANDADEAPEGQRAWWFDGDGDGWGSGEPVVACSAGPGPWVTQDGDCDDADPDVGGGC